MRDTYNVPAGKVEILPGSVAGKIAAGEVIERPASVLRELLDNSIDAGSNDISVEVEDGGLTRVRVTDDGCGMSEADVSLCFEAHATSKVHSLSDLDHIETLGFRGEALSSIAHVARLEISSGQTGGGGGRIVVENGTLREQGPARGSVGTTVDVQQLFFNLPGRKRFLKRSSTERLLCRTVFVEKALAHPDITFRFFADDHKPLVISGAEYPERIAQAYSDYPSSVLKMVEYSGDASSLTIVIADAQFHRRDRKMVQTFVNGRRVWEFGFTQAVEYGVSDMFHGGTWPVCFVFMDVDPYTVDFNIHPAKREARFLHRDRVHHDIVTALKRPELRNGRAVVAETHSADLSAGLWDSGARATSQPQGHHTQRSGGYAHRSAPAAWSIKEPLGPSTPGTNQIRYLGRVFEVFIVVEYSGSLYLIDQHAAHERILYDKLKNDRSTQRLLVPYEFTVEQDQLELVTERIEIAGSLGITIEHAGNQKFCILAVPQAYFGSEAYLVEAITGLEVVAGEFERALYSRIACRSAIMYGDTIDPVTAIELAQSVFDLEEARCPHGRPLYFAISEDDLRKSVGREELRVKHRQLPS